ncbi:uncharacterized protein CXQ87_000490 [Candidozyma duobushaemuli]|nr:uncharacterized protein CXQ87_000490 [[Candida] duobushaemulonis]PVH17599.1 hypothetical protein CXQ87_000490 [[Candida] duobushaemulonis]
MIPQDSLGQLVCGGFQGTTVTSQAYQLIVKYKISTMILSRKNAQSVEQMSKLIRDLQYIAYKHAGYKYPLLFAVDMEGGMLNSLFDSQNLTQFPGAMALAATGDPQLAYEVSKALAEELRFIGFSIILGPVLDVITKLSHQLVSVRSFGTTIDEVTKYGKACAKGLKDGGLITVGKHFPGIGNASVDSLLEVPMMADSLEQIRRFNSVPFAELIHEGLIDGISAAGCGVPTISPDETHACLSPVLINQLLRQEIGFEGFVISECLEMDALYHSIGLGQGVMLAICAGCDLVMVCHDFELQIEAIESISIALNNGTLEEHMLTPSLGRIENIQKRLPQWSKIFPDDNPIDTNLYRLAHPGAWKQHKALSEYAYRRSITLIRDYEGVLPLTQYLGDKGEKNNILILTPLLNPIYPQSEEPSRKNLYPGEAVFSKFGEYLSEFSNSENFNVLHTTYTANGLTALHESLIEHSKAVIVFTSEASRNMYQIGIVKYVSILCGASPSSLSQQSGQSHLSKPLIIVATSSPYDFFYNKSIGSAYLCCYDYTEIVLKELVGVLMGIYTAQGCIPGEKKFIVDKNKKRRLISSPGKSPERPRRYLPPKRKWLVDDFDCHRDWRGLLKLFKANQPNFSESTFRLLVSFLHSTSATQRHFVIRNSSLNILYGVVITWVQDLGSKEYRDEEKTGSIVYLLVDKSKRLQSIGKNLHLRAMRYLLKEQGCSLVNLGCSFPMPVFFDEGFEERNSSFLNNVGWDINEQSKSWPAHVMVLNELSSWSVPQKIFRELMIVGVRFDICSQMEKLQELVSRATESDTQEKGSPASTSTANSPDANPTVTDVRTHNRWLRELYHEAMHCNDTNSAFEAKIIIALEPSNQNVIGGIVLFTNRSNLAKYYPFIEEACLGTGSYKKEALVGGIVGPVIDPSYSNLTEIFKFGLICSAVTYLKSNYCDANSVTSMNSCMMVEVMEGKAFTGIKAIGFEPWKQYHQYYDRQREDEVILGDSN